MQHRKKIKSVTKSASTNMRSEIEALKREVVKTKHYVLVILHAITEQPIGDERDRQVLTNSMHWLQEELEECGHLDNCSCPMHNRFPFRKYQ